MLLQYVLCHVCICLPLTLIRYSCAVNSILFYSILFYSILFIHSVIRVWFLPPSLRSAKAYTSIWAEQEDLTRQNLGISETLNFILHFGMLCCFNFPKMIRKQMMLHAFKMCIITYSGTQLIRRFKGRFGVTGGGNHSNWLQSSCIDSDIIKRRVAIAMRDRECDDSNWRLSLPIDLIK